MSSVHPTRRVTRINRPASVKENENAGARPSRIAVRSKALVTTTGTVFGAAAGGVTRATAASRAKTVGSGDSNDLGKADGQPVKRKREALGEVAVGGNKPLSMPAKGKEKETFDGVVLKSKGVVSRQPLRTVGGIRQDNAPAPAAARPTSKKLTGAHVAAPKEAVARPIPIDDNAMAVDPKPTIPSLVVRRSNTFQDTQPPYRRTTGHQRHSSRSKHPEAEEDEEPAFKKRRTSSVPPEEDPEALEEARLRAEEEALNARIIAEMEAFANEEEANPDQGWDDLDADDVDDPLMVSEYVQEIFDYLKQVELTTMPNPNYMENQKELAWKMRGILTDWLIQVHSRFRLLPETLFLCVNIMDRFLSARVVSLAKLQLVGITCLFIAAKVEEVMAPSVTNFLNCADSSYNDNEILVAERYVLKTLEWNLSYPNPVHYLRRISKADDYNVQVRTLGKYLLEISVVEWRLIAAPPSLMAAASIWLARLALGFEQWTPNLAHYSSYKESEILPTANLMLNYIIKPPRHECFHRKYAAKRYLKSSVYMRNWALARWESGTTINLHADLPRLKAEAKIDRENRQALEVEPDMVKEVDALVAAAEAAARA